MKEECRRQAICDLLTEIAHTKEAANLLATYVVGTPLSDVHASMMAGTELLRTFNDMQLSFANRFIGLTSLYAAALDDLHAMLETTVGGSTQVH